MWLTRQIITLVVNIRVFLIRQLLPSSYLLAPAPGRYREKENALSFFNALNIETSPELVEYITMIKTGEPMKDPLDFVRRVERASSCARTYEGWSSIWPCFIWRICSRTAMKRVRHTSLK
jgi:hypothetical protein